MEINELSTLISDGVLAFAAIYLGSKTPQRGWSLFFLLMGLSAAVGAIGHGFYTGIHNELRVLSWNFLALSLLAAEIESVAPLRKLRSLAISLLVVKAILFIILSWQTYDFLYSIINVAIGMIGIVVTRQVIDYGKNPSASRLIIGGILFSILPAIIQRSRFSISDAWLNYNDIGHYLTIISLYLIFLGVRTELAEGQCGTSTGSSDR